MGYKTIWHGRKLIATDMLLFDVGVIGGYYVKSDMRNENNSLRSSGACMHQKIIIGSNDGELFIELLRICIKIQDILWKKLGGKSCLRKYGFFVSVSMS